MRGIVSEANEIVVEAGFLSDKIVHEGQELIFVLEGSLEVLLEGRDPVVLHAGDTLSYPSMTPHQWTAGMTAARFVIVTSPPSF